MTELERIARVLCESEGHDPDCLIYPGIPAYAAIRGPRGLMVAPTDTPVPAWMIYRNMARVTLSAAIARVGSNECDLKDYIDNILADVDELPQESPPDPEPAPDWRYHYGLK